MSVFWNVRSKLSAWANTRLGWRLTLHSPDRQWLETWVIRNCEYKRTLSIGTSWYTMVLPELVECGWVTVDVTKRAERLASTSDKHYTIDLSLKGTHLGHTECYDNVIVNGVLGRWGVRGPEAAVIMLTKLCRYLKPGGNLLIGINDSPDGIDFDLESTLPTYMTKLHKTLANYDNNHTYIQYCKPL